MNRNRRSSKRKIIVAIVAALFAILLFWLVLHLVVSRGLLDEQFGDSGEWGDEEDEQITLLFGEDQDEVYVSDDNVDTYLIIGTDAGGEFVDEEHSGTLADFLALLIIDNTTEKFGIIQIDRNTMVPMPDLAGVDEDGEGIKQQICLAHWYGEDDSQRNDNTMAMVSDLFGYLPIDNYYAINMENMDRVNEALGGVEVTIDTDMTNVDPAFVQGTSVLLTDDQAGKFLRARMDVGEGTNKERMRRQTQYMQKAYNMVMAQLKENPEYVNDLYDSLSDVIQREETGSNLSRMANHIVQYESQWILQIDGKTTTGDTQEDGVEHEEFYADQQAIIDTLGKIIDLREAEE